MKKTDSSWWSDIN